VPQIVIFQPGLPLSRGNVELDEHAGSESLTYMIVC
jgi:hypothetical protein